MVPRRPIEPPAKIRGATDPLYLAILASTSAFLGSNRLHFKNRFHGIMALTGKNRKIVFSKFILTGCNHFPGIKLGQHDLRVTSADGLRCATVAVKIRDSNFVTLTRQRTLADPTDATDVIWRTAVELTRREVHGMRVRLLGVAASGLSYRHQRDLFAVDDRDQKATAAVDAIRQRFGSRAIRRARLLESDVGAPFERDYQRPPDD
jgi:hypothetical protein